MRPQFGKRTFELDFFNVHSGTKGGIDECKQDAVYQKSNVRRLLIRNTVSEFGEHLVDRTLLLPVTLQHDKQDPKFL
jgi:hypothetical protein